MEKKLGRLPFRAESDDDLIARIPAALEKLWIWEDIEDALKADDRPGLHREHVFDHINLTRMILSKEQLLSRVGGDHLTFIHASFSSPILSLMPLLMVSLSILRPVWELVQDELLANFEVVNVTSGGTVHYIATTK